MSEGNPENLTLMRRAAALVGHSAEYSIAFALLLVCLIVGVSVWLLKPGAPAVTAQKDSSSQTHSADAKGADEQAALGAWKQRLEGGFDQMDQKQRRVEEEHARQERQRQDEERARRERQKQQTEDSTPKPRDKAAQTFAADSSTDLSAVLDSSPPVIPAPRVVPPKPQAVQTNASIDWSSCKRPTYPDISVRNNQQGAVTVAVDLDGNAHVLRSRIAESSGYDRLDVAAQRAIEKCRFHPATVDGVPQTQPSTANVRFTWALQGK